MSVKDYGGWCPTVVYSIFGGARKSALCQCIQDAGVFHWTCLDSTDKFELAYGCKTQNCNFWRNGRIAPAPCRHHMTSTDNKHVHIRWHGLLHRYCATSIITLVASKVGNSMSYYWSTVPIRQAKYSTVERASVSISPSCPDTKHVSIFIFKEWETKDMEYAPSWT